MADMESWFKDTGRPAFFQALAEACGRIEEDFRDVVKTELDNKAALEAELHFLRLKVGNVERLEQQNKTLREELSHLRKPARSLLNSNQKQISPSKSRPSSSREIRTPLAPLAVNEASGLRRSIKHDHPDVESLGHDDLLLEYSKLEDKYDRVRGQYSETIKANETLKERLREKTKSCDNWIKHAEKLNAQSQARGRKVKQLKAELDTATRNSAAESSFISDADSVFEAARHPIVPPLDEAQLEQAIQTTLQERATSEDDGCFIFMEAAKLPISGLDGNRRSIHGILSNPSLGNIETSTDSKPGSPKSPMIGAVPNNLAQQTPRSEDESSLPPLPENQGVGSSQILVKNEPSSDAPVVISERCLRKRKHAEDDSVSTPQPTRVKTEDGSDPVVTDEQHRFTLQESVDFDEAEGRVPTPRKHRGNDSTRRSTRKNPGPEIVTVDRSHKTTHRLASPEDHSLYQVSMSAHVQERVRAMKEHRDEAIHHRTAASDYEEPMLDYGTTSRRSSALRPLDVNSPVAKFLERKPKFNARVSHPVPEGIASLAEDGDEPDLTQPATGGSKRSGKLNKLLFSAAPGPEVIAVPNRVQAENMPKPPVFRIQMPQKRDLPFGREKRTKVSSALQLPESPVAGNPKRTSTSIHPKKKPETATTDVSERSALRERPKSELRLDDFKVNPTYNDGLDYVYTEVVRGKDARARLRGCTNERCCKPFYRQEAQRVRDETGTLAFQSLLENYLGDECWRLSTMSSDEKEKMWLEAKIEQQANIYGKCRFNYPRPSSPPGYWRQDFANTQEELQDQAEAAEREREMVEERWMEAIRSNGRWLFRDE